jgi:hypothetical protein
LTSLAWLFLGELLNLASWLTANVMSGLLFNDKYMSIPTKNNCSWIHPYALLHYEQFQDMLLA